MNILMSIQVSTYTNTTHSSPNSFIPPENDNFIFFHWIQIKAKRYNRFIDSIINYKVS
jgi:hypothetical protein